MKIVSLLLCSGLALSACQPQCKCAEAAHPATAIAAQPSAVAPPVETPQPAPPTSADAPAEASPEAEADTRGVPAKRGPKIHGRGFIEIEDAGKVRRLAGGCYHNQDEYDPMPGPYAEVLDPNTASPRFIIDSCGAAGTHFDIVGTSTQLPGDVKVMRARFYDPKTGEEWESTSATLHVDGFGAVGAMLTGTFTAVMAARLNRPAVTIRGRFELPRAPDRYRP